MKKGKRTLYILQFFIIIFFLCILLVSKVLTNKILVAFFLMVYAFIAKMLINRSKPISIYKKEVFKYMTMFAIIYIVMYYVLGIYVGYYTSTYKFGFKTLINYIIPLMVIIISSEIIRGEFLTEKTKLARFNTILFIVLVDLVVYVNIYNLFNLNEFLQALGYIFFASIISNILFNYVAEEFGIVPNISYRLITTLYLYIIPVTPDVYIYFKSVCRMIYPMLVYISLKSVYEKDKLIVKKQSKTVKSLTTTGTIIFMAIIAGLISCKFTYGMLVIGSGSMTGTIDKGDAIIYRREKKIDNVSKGDIIVFKSNEKRIVHRVVKIDDINGELRLYTKGDNNVQQDPDYVKEDSLVGIVKLKISKIGMPTIWLNEFFKGIKRGK